MSKTKLSYVGSNQGELSVVVTPTDLVVSFDLLIPNAPLFLLKTSLVQVTDHTDAFHAAYQALVQQMSGFLLSCGVDQGMVNQLYTNISEAAKKLDDDDRADRSGSGGSPLMDKIIELEPLDVFELKFDVPKGFIQELHQKVVTAQVIKRSPPTVKLPPNFQTGPGAKLLQRPTPSLKDLIMKYKPQQGKKLTGPVFVMVYDVNGRPVGVRQLQGPGWKGIGGRVAAQHVNSTCPTCGGTTRCKCLTSTHRALGGVPATTEVCYSCSEKAKTAADVVDGVPFVKTHPDQVRAEALGLMHFIQQNRFNYIGLNQQQTGTFYLVFRGPVSQLMQKIRISDHPKPTYHNPDTERQRHCDFSVEPTPGHSMADAMAWIKTAARDVVEVQSWNQGKVRVPVFVNPSRSEIQNILDKDGCARAFLIPDKHTLIVWSGMSALHNAISGQYLPTLGVSQRGAIPLTLWENKTVTVTDFAKQTSWNHCPEVAETLFTSRPLAMALGGPPTAISYYDQDETGPWEALGQDDHEVKPTQDQPITIATSTPTLFTRRPGASE